MPELLTYTPSDFADLASLMQELSGNIVFTRESFDRMLADILHPTFSEKGSGFLFKLRRLKANMWKRNHVATEALVPRLARLAWSHVIRPEKMVEG